MKVYLVLAGYNYYPDWNNVKFVTTSEVTRRGIRRKGKYDWVDVSVKCVDK